MIHSGEHLFEPGEYLVRFKNFLFQQQQKKNSYIEILKTNFLNRNYIFIFQIVPVSFNFWYTGSVEGNSNNLYNLVIHSSKASVIEQEVCRPFLMADAMIELCITKGSVTSRGLANSCLYTLSSGYSGLIVVAENCNDNVCLHIELDCENSVNVVSTRRTLITKDSVPPLHRQVLMVLTQLEGSSSYSINYSMKYRLSSNRFLNTWPGSEGKREVNLPKITQETLALHAPRTVFN